IIKVELYLGKIWEMKAPGYGKVLGVPLGGQASRSRQRVTAFAVERLGVANRSSIMAAAEEVGIPRQPGGLKYRLLRRVQSRLVVVGLCVEGEEVGVVIKSAEIGIASRSQAVIGRGLVGIIPAVSDLDIAVQPEAGVVSNLQLRRRRNRQGHCDCADCQNRALDRPRHDYSSSTFALFLSLASRSLRSCSDFCFLSQSRRDG